MKLTIKNYKNILGQYGPLTIINAIELPDYYIFVVNNVENRVRDIFVNRAGRVDTDGDTIFHFGEDGRYTQSVTPKWFGNIKNAVSAILSEYDTI